MPSDPLKALMYSRAISPDTSKAAQIQRHLREDPTLGEAIAPLKFPAKIPGLPTGHRLLDQVWGQIDKIREGRAGSMKALGEILPDYKPGEIGKYLHTNANVEPAAQAYFDRITHASTDKSIPEKVWNAIANGSHKLAVEDNHTLEQIMR